jgi:hypothetical protein
MVSACRRVTLYVMGDLDDAIREHLELKRLHGADPHEVARLEHEALGAVPRGAAEAYALPVELELELELELEPEPVVVLAEAPNVGYHADDVVVPSPEGGEATQEFHIELEERWADESVDHAAHLDRS